MSKAMMTLKALQEGNKANDDAVASGLSQETHKGKAKNAVTRRDPSTPSSGRQYCRNLLREDSNPLLEEDSGKIN